MDGDSFTHRTFNQRAFLIFRVCAYGAVVSIIEVDIVVTIIVEIALDFYIFIVELMDGSTVSFDLVEGLTAYRAGVGALARPSADTGETEGVGAREV